MSRTAWIAFVVAGIALVVGLVTATLLVGGGGTKASPIVTVSTPNGAPTPISLTLEYDPNSLMLGQHKQDVLAGIAARPGGPVEIAVLRAETAIPADQLTVRIDGRKVDAQTCGSTCARVQARVLEGSPSRLSLQALGETFSFALPPRLPQTGETVLAKARKTMDRLRSFRFSESLSSGRGTVKSEYALQSPNRLELRTTGGVRSVIIGRKRWDFQARRWTRNSFPGLRVSQLLVWQGATHPRIVDRLPGGGTELVAFSVQPVPAWFRLVVAPSGLVREMEMTAASHFMLHRYRDYNGQFSIKPPTTK